MQNSYVYYGLSLVSMFLEVDHVFSLEPVSLSDFGPGDKIAAFPGRHVP